MSPADPKHTSHTGAEQHPRTRTFNISDIPNSPNLEGAPHASFRGWPAEAIEDKRASDQQPRKGKQHRDNIRSSS
eukprot:2505149-Alexandrium_andersonii.AAC.1